MDSKKVLVVIDMQNDFVTGSLGSSQAQAIVPNVVNKIKEYVDNGSLVIATRDTHDDDYLDTQEGKKLPVKHCIINTDGHNIIPELRKTVFCSIIDKPTFGSIEELHDVIYFDFVEYDIKEIELCGLCSDICVVSNAIILKAWFPEIKIVVDAKCCAGVTEESHKAALLTMKMCQIEVINE